VDPQRWPLLPFAALYGAAVRARNLYYDRRCSATRRAAVPVISVGNLTVGGTDKTPMVIEIVRRLQAWGRRPAILTRGYQAPRGQTADEVLEFAQAVPHTPVVVNPDRVAGATEAVERHRADCLVLDDGFQHRRLQRDLDLVLIDALDPWGGGHVLPAGRQREPRSGLRRAGAFVITRANQASAEALRAIADELRRFGSQPILHANVVPDAVFGMNGDSTTPDALAGTTVLAVGGLGNPLTFKRLVERLTRRPCAVKFYNDHHRYRPADVTHLQEVARRAGAAEVVTTRKDWVKLAPLWPAAGPQLWRLDVRLDLPAGDELDARLRRALRRAD